MKKSRANPYRRRRGLRVFVSYAWEDGECGAYREKVIQLAHRMRTRDGIDVRLDKWHVDGRALSEFMQAECRAADKILVLCSPSYKAKVHDMESGGSARGAGWESMLLSSSIVTNQRKARDLHCVLMRGVWRDSAPSWLVGRSYTDLSNPDTYERAYARLVDELKNGLKAPELSANRHPPVCDNDPCEDGGVKTDEPHHLAVASGTVDMVLRVDLGDQTPAEFLNLLSQACKIGSVTLKKVVDGQGSSREAKS